MDHFLLFWTSYPANQHWFGPSRPATKVNWGLEGTSDSWKLQNSAWHPFYGWIYHNKNVCTRSGSNAIKDCVRPAPRTRVFVIINSIIKWMPRRVSEFPWISEVSSNPHLTLAPTPLECPLILEAWQTKFRIFKYLLFALLYLTKPFIRVFIYMVWPKFECFHRFCSKSYKKLTVRSIKLV